MQQRRMLNLNPYGGLQRQSSYHLFLNQVLETFRESGAFFVSRE